MKKILALILFGFCLIAIFAGEARAVRAINRIEVALAPGDTVHLCYTDEFQVLVKIPSREEPDQWEIVEVEEFDFGGEVTQIGLGAVPGEEALKLTNENFHVSFHNAVTLLPLPVRLFRILSNQGGEYEMYVAVQLAGDPDPCVEEYEIEDGYRIIPDPDGDGYFPLKFTKIVSTEEEPSPASEANPAVPDGAMLPDAQPMPSGGCSIIATGGHAGSGLGLCLGFLGFLGGFIRIRK